MFFYLHKKLTKFVVGNFFQTLVGSVHRPVLRAVKHQQVAAGVDARELAVGGEERAVGEDGGLAAGQEAEGGGGGVVGEREVDGVLRASEKCRVA